jgi:hypothetical protein
MRDVEELIQLTGLCRSGREHYVILKATLTVRRENNIKSSGEKKLDHEGVGTFLAFLLETETYLLPEHCYSWLDN